MFLPIQKAAIAAISGDQSCVASTRAAYERRRDCLCNGLASIGWKMEKPEGTMFVLSLIHIYPNRNIRIKRVKTRVTITVIIVNHNFFLCRIDNPVFPDT